MPIYEYHCSACGHEHEALQKISDSPLRKCPECGKLALRRVLSAVSFRLKGGGWYETDFKSDGEKKRNLVETASSDSGEKAAKDGDAAKDSASSDKEEKKAEPAKPEPPEKKAAASAARARTHKKPASKPRTGKSARA
jgi:putative FmdB family regulatory protein